MGDRIFSEKTSALEKNNEVHLRPENFSEFIGQEKIVENIEIMVASSNSRGQAMDHTLLSGPPGLGKTSLAMLIAKELNSELHVISGPVIEKKGDIAALLTNLGPRDVLFIDEIHRMNISLEEILYSAMEDYRLDIVMGQGPSARTMEISLSPFTLIGATTRAGLLSNPLRDRFVAHLHFDFYSSKNLKIIIQNNCKKLKMNLNELALMKISKCARGTPRIANRILRRLRDYAIVKKIELVGEEEVLKALDLMDIDGLGLDRMDRKILGVICDYYNGGPVGIEAICATLGEDRITIEDVYEPFLLQEGYLLRTPRGREISQRGLEHLKGELGKGEESGGLAGSKSQRSLMAKVKRDIQTSLF